jgi:HlyD family secretion protein
MTSKSIKSIIKIILAVSFIGALVYALMPEKIKVDIVSLERGDLLITLDGEGKTRIHDIYTVSTPIDGRITRIESEPGDFVTAGETLIANMYPANPNFLDKRAETQAQADVQGAQAALSLANSRVKQAKAQLEFDKSDYKRTQELFNKKSISKAGLERAELRLKTLQAEYETALSNKNVMQSRLESSQARLLKPSEEDLHDKDDCQICIRSPVDGRVLRILHKSESIVPVGTALVEIGDPADLEINIEMLSGNAVKVQVGDEAIIKRWGGESELKATVKVIEPSGFTKISALGVEEQRVNIILSFTDPREKWQSLGDAFRVEASIIVDRVENALLVPISALFRDNEQWVVFKEIDGNAHLQKVKVGRKNDSYAEVLDGLDISDKIIIHPGNSVADGVKIVQR